MELGSTSTGFQWKGSTPTGLQETFRAANTKEHAHAYAYAHTHTHAHVQAHDTCMHMHTHTHTRTRTRTRTCTRTRIRTCTCTHLCNCFENTYVCTSPKKVRQIKIIQITQTKRHTDIQTHTQTKIDVPNQRLHTYTKCKNYIHMHKTYM